MPLISDLGLVGSLWPPQLSNQKSFFTSFKIITILNQNQRYLRHFIHAGAICATSEIQEDFIKFELHLKCF